MSKSSSYFCLVALTLTLFSGIALAEEPPLGNDYLLLAADPWCPFNCTPDTNKEGVMVDLAREAMRSKGIKVKYVIRPWQRAINEAKAGVIDGIIGAGVSDGEGLILPNTPYAMSAQGIAVLKEDNIIWKDAFSIGDRRLVKIKGYGYGGVLNDFLDSVTKSEQVFDNTGDKVLTRNLIMILKGRADITIDEINVLKLAAADEGIHQHFKFLKTGIENKLFIALSPKIDRSKDIARWLDTEIKLMVADGRYEQILRKYEMNPWLE